MDMTAGKPISEAQLLVTLVQISAKDCKTFGPLTAGDEVMAAAAGCLE
jgi:hypothetical protein